MNQFIWFVLFCMSCQFEHYNLQHKWYNLVNFWQGHFASEGDAWRLVTRPINIQQEAKWRNCLPPKKRCQSLCWFHIPRKHQTPTEIWQDALPSLLWDCWLNMMQYGVQMEGNREVISMEVSALEIEIKGKEKAGRDILQNIKGYLKSINWGHVFKALPREQRSCTST